MYIWKTYLHFYVYDLCQFKANVMSYSIFSQFSLLVTYKRYHTDFDQLPAESCWRHLKNNIVYIQYSPYLMVSLVLNTVPRRFSWNLRSSTAVYSTSIVGLIDPSSSLFTLRRLRSTPILSLPSAITTRMLIRD